MYDHAAGPLIFEAQHNVLKQDVPDVFPEAKSLST